MKNKDKLRTAVLRMMKTAMKNREIEKKDDLSDKEVIQVLNTMVKQRKEAIEQFRAGGRPELADKEEQEVAIVESYLPEPISDEVMDETVSVVVEEMKAEGPKDMGRVMKETLARLDSSGKTVDGKAVSRLVKEKLQKMSESEGGE